MNCLSDSIATLQKSLQVLPGIGQKTAQRLAYFIVNQPKEKSQFIADSIINALHQCKICSLCFLLSDTDPCPICADQSRNQELLCIVENSQDILLIENTREYQGKYFVLGGVLSPLDGIGPNEIHLQELSTLIHSHTFQEIIIALTPSTEGETTIQFLADFFSGEKITRLSMGIPFGCDIEYTGSKTMLTAFRRRYPV